MRLLALFLMLFSQISIASDLPKTCQNLPDPLKSNLTLQQAASEAVEVYREVMEKQEKAPQTISRCVYINEPEQLAHLKVDGHTLILIDSRQGTLTLNSTLTTPGYHLLWVGIPKDQRNPLDTATLSIDKRGSLSICDQCSAGTDALTLFHRIGIRETRTGSDRSMVHILGSLIMEESQLTAYKGRGIEAWANDKNQFTWLKANLSFSTESTSPLVHLEGYAQVTVEGTNFIDSRLPTQFINQSETTLLKVASAEDALISHSQFTRLSQNGKTVAAYLDAEFLSFTGNHFTGYVDSFSLDTARSTILDGSDNTFDPETITDPVRFATALTGSNDIDFSVPPQLHLPIHELFAREAGSGFGESTTNTTTSAPMNDGGLGGLEIAGIVFVGIKVCLIGAAIIWGCTCCALETTSNAYKSISKMRRDYAMRGITRNPNIESGEELTDGVVAVTLTAFQKFIANHRIIRRVIVPPYVHAGSSIRWFAERARTVVLTLAAFTWLAFAGG